MNEKHLTVMGIRLWRLYIGWGINEVVGEPHRVEMDSTTIKPEWLYLGHAHTHPPDCFFTPSSQDNRTMNGLVNYYGKSLLSFISNNKGSSCNLYCEYGDLTKRIKMNHWIKGRLFLAWL